MNVAKQRFTLPAGRAFAQIESITPDQAELYLQMSKGNRSLKEAKIDSLQRDMLAGNFRMNGESIIFSEDGTLIDGHHRLCACLKSGLKIQSVVVRGVASDTKSTIDTGASRTAGDHLSIDGYKNSNTLASICNVLLSLRLGRPRSANPSVSEVYEFIQEHPLIHYAATFAAFKKVPRVSALLGAIYLIAAENAETETAEMFRDVLSSGVPAYPGCPAHALRERISRDAMRGKPTPLRELHKIFFAAWNKFTMGETASVLKAPKSFSANWWT